MMLRLLSWVISIAGPNKVTHKDGIRMWKQLLKYQLQEQAGQDAGPLPI